MKRSQARVLRKNPTESERTLWKHLRLRQLEGWKFRRQHPLGPYIVDFVCLEKRLVIELDGGQHSEQTLYDTERTAWLETQGFQVLRFWNNQVLQETEVVKEVILEALRTSPHLNPPPKGGRRRERESLPPKGGGAARESLAGKEKSEGKPRWQGAGEESIFCTPTSILPLKGEENDNLPSPVTHSYALPVSGGIEGGGK